MTCAEGNTEAPGLAGRCRFRRGRRAGHAGDGSPRNLGGLAVSTGDAAHGLPPYKCVPAPGAAHSRGRRTRPLARTGHTRGTAKRRQRSAAGWAARSRSSLILPLKSGNRPHGTRRREAADRIMGCRADRRHGHRATSRLNASPAASGESSETAARGCAPAQRCHGPRSRMPELGTFGSVGAGGGQPPSATRPHPVYAPHHDDDGR